MMDAAETLGKDVGLHSACQAMGVSRASFYRRRQRKEVPMTEGRASRSARALSTQEREQVRDTLNSDRFMDKAPREVYATLLDDGEYICSVRTMYRILHEEKAVRERRNQLTHPNYKKPELLATGPNQVWSWDITKLLGPQKWSYYYLYVILDIYSRYVVGWMLAHREAASLASRLIRETIEKQGVLEDHLTIHSDRGPSMASQTVAQLLASLGVVKSHSRPHVSNDNPFSESQFKTMKYRPEFPNRFGGYEDARSHCRSFFPWYNDEHYHTGIGLLTPAMLHYGGAEKVIEDRAHVLQGAYESHPERFVRGCPKPQTLPDAVWINPPITASELGHDNNLPLIEIQTPYGTIGVKSELEVSPLTSAKATSLPEAPGQIAPSLNKADQEKRLPEIVDYWKPDAPLTHPRPGYPLTSCVPTELASVSPGAVKSTDSNVHLQSPLNTRAMPEKIPGVRGLAPDEVPREETTMKSLH
jgi:putative transposase